MSLSSPSIANTF